MDNKNKINKAAAAVKGNMLYIILAVLIAAAAGTSLYISRDKEEPVVIYESSSMDKYTSSMSKSSTSNTQSTQNATVSGSEKASSSKKQTMDTKISGSSTSKTSADFPIEINSVTCEELMQINGVGEKTAAKIISYRNSVDVIFNMDMLLDIDGIGNTTLGMLKKYLYVSDEYYRDMPEQTVTQSQTHTSTANTTIKTDVTVTSKLTSAAKTTATATVTSVTTTAPPSELKAVNVNSASAEEIAECLLIDMEIAESIVSLREQLNGFTSIYELLYSDVMSESMLSDLRNYILL